MCHIQRNSLIVSHSVWLASSHMMMSYAGGSDDESVVWSVVNIILPRHAYLIICHNDHFLVTDRLPTLTFLSENCLRRLCSTGVNRLGFVDRLFSWSWLGLTGPKVRSIYYQQTVGL